MAASPQRGAGRHRRQPLVDQVDRHRHRALPDPLHKTAPTAPRFPPHRTATAEGPPPPRRPPARPRWPPRRRPPRRGSRSPPATPAPLRCRRRRPRSAPHRGRPPPRRPECRASVTGSRPGAATPAPPRARRRRRPGCCRHPGRRRPCRRLGPRWRAGRQPARPAPRGRRLWPVSLTAATAATLPSVTDRASTTAGRSCPARPRVASARSRSAPAVEVVRRPEGEEVDVADPFGRRQRRPRGRPASCARLAARDLLLRLAETLHDPGDPLRQVVGWHLQLLGEQRERGCARAPGTGRRRSRRAPRSVGRRHRCTTRAAA